jgi:hypothetical protein
MKFKDLKDVRIFDSLSMGLEDNHKDSLISLMSKTCEDYSFLFEDLDEDLILYILPSLRRVYSKFFIDIPPILSHDESRLELFKLSFDLDEFLRYLHQMIIEKRDILNFFENLDSQSEFLSLVVQNYVSGKIKLTRCNDVVTKVRDLKIKRLYE